MFVRIVQQMKKIDFEKYLVDIKQDICLRILNIDYVILFKRLMVDCDGQCCRRSTPRDDRANGAHTMRGSTDGGSCTDK